MLSFLRPKERHAAAWVTLAFLLLIGSGVLSFYSLAQITEGMRWVDHTREVIERLDAALFWLRGLDDAQREFVLSGKESVPEGLSVLQRCFGDVRSLTRDNRSQQERFQPLEPLLHRLAEFEHTLQSLKGGGFPPLASANLAQQGEQLTARIRELGRQMRSEEYRLLSQRSEQVRRSVHQTRVVLLVGRIGAILLFAFAVMGLQRERKLRFQTGRALAESEKLYKLAVDAAGIGTWSWDLTTNELWWSMRCKEMFGLPAPTLVTYQVFQDALHFDDRIPTRAAVDRSLQTGSEFNVEYRAVWPDCSVHWIHAKGRPYRSPSGNSIRLEGIVIDIHETKIAHRALERSERRYSALFANKINAVAHLRMLTDTGGKAIDYEIVEVNHAYELVTGLKKSDVEGRRATEVFPGHEESDFGLIGTYETIARNRSEESFELFFNRLNRWLSIYAYSPDPGEVIAIFTDITQQKWSEEALQASEERFRQLAENIQKVFWIADPLSGRAIYVSPAYATVWGRTPESRETNPDEWLEAIEDGHRERVRDAFLTAMKTGVFEETYVVLRPDGSRCWVRDRGWPILDPQGKVYRMVGLAQDITEGYQAQVEIKRLNAELENRVAERTSELEMANRELEAFAYSVSHDLRAPLRGIDGFARILLEEYAPQLDAEPRRYLEMVRNEALRMGDLVDDLLSFSRLSRQELKLRLVNVESLVRQVWNDLQAEREGRSVELIMGAMPSSAAEPAMLRQVWFNLLSNALKFTRKREHGRIEVGSVAPAKASKGAVYFVKDNGVGFDTRYAAKLFGVFQRLHRAEDYEGTGVGLAIVQRIVRRHGGDIRAESEPNRGALFYFSLSEDLPQPATAMSAAHA